MNKKIVTGLTTAVMVGMMSATSFAATNPFSDVPHDHWAYDAVSDLAKEGIVNGYGDKTFQGDKEITRYEMAQMVAKAMAHSDRADAKQKVMIHRLAVEFSSELSNLGTRVSNLEKFADKVAWNGEVRYTLNDNRSESALSKANEKVNNAFEVRLEPTAEVNDNLIVSARVSGYVDANKDTETNLELNRVFAETNVGGVDVQLGKVGTSDVSNLVLDNDYHSFTGVSATAESNDVQVYAGAGRFKADNGSFVSDHKLTDTADYQFAGAQYDNGKLSVGGAYHHLKSDDLKGVGTKDGDVDVWTTNLGYQFDKNFGFKASYAENANVDEGHQAYDFTMNYRGANASAPNSWGLYAGYRNLGENVTLAPTFNGMVAGERGYVFGGDYTLTKDVVLSGSYFTGKSVKLSGQDENASALFGRVQFFF